MEEEDFMRLLMNGEEDAKKYTKDTYLICVDTPCVEQNTNDAFEKCKICYGYYEDNGINDILFLNFWDKHENFCGVCNMYSKNLVQMKSTGEYLCKNGCDESDDEEEEEEEEEEEDEHDRNERYVSMLLRYLTKEENHYKYKLKKSVYEWYVRSKCTGNDFWCSMGENDSSGFLLNNLYHIQQLICANYNDDFEKYEGHGDIMELFINIIENDYPRIRIDWYLLALNEHPKVVKLIEANLDKLDYREWNCLSTNKNAIHIIEANIDKVEEYDTWDSLCMNPAAIEILTNHQDKYNNYQLCINSNPDILKMVDINSLDEDDWSVLFSNSSARFIFENHMDKLTESISSSLFSNTNAIDLIEKYLEENEIRASQLSELCSNVNAIHLLKNYIHILRKQDIYVLNQNPAALDLLEEHPYLMNSFVLLNPGIFEAK